VTIDLYVLIGGISLSVQDFYSSPLPVQSSSSEILFQMIRHAFRMRIPVECATEYTRRHNEIWPDLVNALKSAGVSDYSIYLDESTGDLFASMVVQSHEALAELAEQDVMKRWWEANKDIQCYDGDRPTSTVLKEVFHLS
jgi:L-rhamnose mutarotase